METFSMHETDAATAPMIANLMNERSEHASFALTSSANIAKTDPETIASRYLQQALQSKETPALTAPKSGGVTSDFRSLGTETIPLTGTTSVKFRQVFNNIPVYGSLVTVELDDENRLVSLGSTIGKPENVDPIAKIAPNAAVKAVAKYAGYKKQLKGIVPHLNYYFDRSAAKWKLVFILEDVPVSYGGRKKSEVPIMPRYMDYVVDADDGTVISELPRTTSMAQATETATDEMKVSRKFQAEVSGSKKVMFDSTLNIQTYDFGFRDPEQEEAALPGKPVSSPPLWKSAAVSAHCNAAAVATFLRGTLLRNNIDNNGGLMKSSINCVVQEESQGRQWLNAFWNGQQMVYGQRQDGSKLLSLSADLDVVGHEMFHGVTEATARLEYVSQSGALNESISDIFGIIIANFAREDTRTWNWKVGEGLSSSGKPLRDMSDPPLFGQPEHMRDFKVLPETKDGDMGGVHTNSGIHNKAAYNILVATNRSQQLVFAPKDVAAMFYLSLWQQLSRTSQFSDSRRGVLTSARSLFRTRPAAELAEKVQAVEASFDAVGIK